MNRLSKFFISTILIASSIFVSCASTDKPTPVSSTPAGSTAEYQRSINKVNISVEEFNQDKKEILEIISKLDSIMKNQDYKSWVSYVDKESINYWSRPANLQKAAARLPGASKNLKLTSLEDYFKYVFIGSRVGKRVDEIRYETAKKVKAVQVNGENDTVYYFFNKIDGKWKLSLPAIE